MLLTVFMVGMECGRADSLQRHAWYVGAWLIWMAC